jgi:hypothetical protein
MFVFDSARSTVVEGNGTMKICPRCATGSGARHHSQAVSMPIFRARSIVSQRYMSEKARTREPEMHVQTKTRPSMTGRGARFRDVDSLSERGCASEKAPSEVCEERKELLTTMS